MAQLWMMKPAVALAVVAISVRGTAVAVSGSEEVGEDAQVSLRGGNSSWLEEDTVDYGEASTPPEKWALFYSLQGDGEDNPRETMGERMKRYKEETKRRAREIKNATTGNPPLATGGPIGKYLDQGMSVEAETFFVVVYVAMIASVPLILVAFSNERLTRVHVVESVSLIVWLVGALYTFTHVIKFQSVHFEGIRTLSITETIYLLSQVITTVGYGDITPAFPRGQVFMAMYVLAALLLYGGLIMEVATIISTRISSRYKNGSASEEERREMYKNKSLKNWENIGDIPWFPMVSSCVFFGSVVAMGVVFFLTYPGEQKNLFQCVYMSIITLSTVGFGNFTALTAGGKVFAAFWMLFGVAAMGSVIGASIDIMLHMKANQRYTMKSTEDQLRFRELIDANAVSGNDGMDLYEFMKFGLLLNNIVTEDQLVKIEARFDGLGPDEDGNLSRDQILEHEQPPFDQTD